MNFREFESIISNFPLFNLNDVRKIDPGFHRQQLTYWINQGFIIPLAGGYYRHFKTQVTEPFLFMLANKIYEPSYVSLESALAYYQVIPETVFGVTSISSRKTTLFESKFGNFQYHSIRPAYLFGYEIIETNSKLKFKISTLIKTIIDYLYLHSEIRSIEDFEMWRWNVEALQPLVRDEKTMIYLDQFGKKSLNRRYRILMEYLNA